MNTTLSNKDDVELIISNWNALNLQKVISIDICLINLNTIKRVLAHLSM